MKEYSYKEIRKITQTGILFMDGAELLFEECRNGWCIEHGIKKEQLHCIAERDSLEKTPYFLFYSKDKIKIVFDKKGIFRMKRNRDDFCDLQVALNRFGFSSCDLT